MSTYLSTDTFLLIISFQSVTYLSSFSASIAATLSIVDSSIVSTDSLSAACSPSSSSSSSEEEDDAEEDDDELSEEEEEMLSSSLSALRASSEKREKERKSLDSKTQIYKIQLDRHIKT